jgi:hypothetical protein
VIASRPGEEETIAYHGVNDGDVESVLSEGLLISKTKVARDRTFWHLSFAATPGIAAVFGTVIEVDLTGFDMPEEGFVGGELRLHEDVPPERLRRLDVQPAPTSGHLDPAKNGKPNHPTCLRLRCWEHPSS